MEVLSEDAYKGKLKRDNMSDWISILNGNSGAIVAIATIVLVLVTIVYAWLTHKTVEQSKKQQRASYIEKRLEKLYNPLDDVLNSEYMFYLTDVQSYIQFENNGAFNPNTKWHDVDELVQYQHLASDRLEEPLDEFFVRMRKSNPAEEVSNPDFTNIVDRLQKIVTLDIKALKKELRDLNKH